MKFLNVNYNEHFFIFLQYIQKYCFILLPFFLITGPFLSDLSIVLIGLIYLLILIKEKIIKKLSFNLNIFFLFILFLYNYMFFIIIQYFIIFGIISILL